MDDLAREILETIDTYRKRGVNERWPETGEAYISVKFSVPGFEDDAEVRIPDPEFCQPSVDFEKEYGLQGLSGQHRLPEGISAHDLETYVALLVHRDDLSERQCLDKVKRVWSQLVDDNPVLQQMHVQVEASQELSARVIIDMIFGVTSAFSTSDIQYFVANRPGTGDPFSEMCGRPDYRGLKKLFNRQGVRFRKVPDLAWAASPETVQAISRQLLAKPAKSACRKTGNKGRLTN